MSLFRLRFLAVALSLSGCVVTTAPAPSEFGLSSEAIRQRYPASRTMGIVQLYAQQIVATKDEKGRDAYLASGGALLVKKSKPPIYAKAPSILITADFAEVRGKSTVQKGDRLFIGKADDAKFIIDGIAIKAHGLTETRAVSSDTSKPVKSEPVETKPSTTPETKRTTDDTPTKRREVASDSSTKPKVKPTKPATESTTTAPSPPPTKAVTPEERARLLNLMRAPKAE